MTLGIFALPELCDLLGRPYLGRARASAIDTKTGMLLGIKDCFTHWFLVLRCSWIGSFMGAIPGIGGLRHRLDLLRPCAAHRKRRTADFWHAATYAA